MWEDHPMLSPIRRIRGVIGARLHLLQARYEAAASAVELRPSIDALHAQTAELQNLQGHDALELRTAIAELRDLQGHEALELRTAIAELRDLPERMRRWNCARQSPSYKVVRPSISA